MCKDWQTNVSQVAWRNLIVYLEDQNLPPQFRDDWLCDNSLSHVKRLDCLDLYTGRETTDQFGRLLDKVRDAGALLRSIRALVAIKLQSLLQLLTKHPRVHQLQLDEMEHPANTPGALPETYRNGLAENIKALRHLDFTFEGDLANYSLPIKTAAVLTQEAPALKRPRLCHHLSQPIEERDDVLSDFAAIASPVRALQDPMRHIHDLELVGTDLIDPSSMPSGVRM